MGILGARSGDLGACLAGDDAACRRVMFGYFVFPHLQHLLEKLKLAELPQIVFPEPRPDPPPFNRLEEAMPIFLAVLGDPNPQPSILDARLDALKTFRDGLDDLRESLDKDIKSIEAARKRTAD